MSARSRSSTSTASRTVVPSGVISRSVDDDEHVAADHGDRRRLVVVRAELRERQ
jgi:hypothetical protein